MTSHLTTISAAADALRVALAAIDPLPSGPLLDAHHHIEEILLCVARHDEDAARRRAAETIRASQDRLNRLRRDCLRSEMTSPRPLPQAASVAQAGDIRGRAVNTRTDIEQAFGIQPPPASIVTRIVSLPAGGARA